MPKARVWQGTCRSTPDAMADAVRTKALLAVKVAMETGPLAVWHWHALKAAGVPIVCIHARHAKAALSMQINKTDSNDAFGLAQIVRTGWYRPVDVKSMESHRLRLLVVARARVVSMRTGLYSQIRGLLKTFGVVLAPGKGSSFEQLVLRGILNDHSVRVVVESLLSTWRHLSTELKKLNREIGRAARAIPVCRQLMTVPGVGSLTAVAYATTVDEPSRFRRSKDLGPYLGMTPRKYQSGDVDRTGSISKCGDRTTRSLLFEAAGVLLFRNRQSCALKEWGLNSLGERGHGRPESLWRVNLLSCCIGCGPTGVSSSPTAPSESLNPPDQLFRDSHGASSACPLLGRRMKLSRDSLSVGLGRANHIGKLQRHLATC